jgi:hypothetical protein
MVVFFPDFYLYFLGNNPINPLAALQQYKKIQLLESAETVLFVWIQTKTHNFQFVGFIYDIASSRIFLMEDTTFG